MNLNIFLSCSFSFRYFDIRSIAETVESLFGVISSFNSLVLNTVSNLVNPIPLHFLALEPSLKLPSELVKDCLH